MLTTSLRELERDGLVSRVQFNEIPPRVEYSLTEKGRALLPVFYEMTRWGFRYIPCGRLCKNAALSCGIFAIHLFSTHFGPSSATRTHDLHIPNVARYQLRYTRKLKCYCIIAQGKKKSKAFLPAGSFLREEA